MLCRHPTRQTDSNYIEAGAECTTGVVQAHSYTHMYTPCWSYVHVYSGGTVTLYTPAQLSSGRKKGGTYAPKIFTLDKCRNSETDTYVWSETVKS